MKQKVNIVTGFSNPGGSTIAFINLCNLLNDSGLYECTLWGPHPWHLDKCCAMPVQELKPDWHAVIISHYCNIAKSFPCKKHILSIHESKMFDLKDDKYDKTTWDKIVYVSQSQKNFHECTGTVIPNIVTQLTKRKKIAGETPVVGIIGSIDAHKQTHVSVQRAKRDGFEHIEIFGDTTDPKYFKLFVQPKLNRSVRYLGFCDNKQAMYENLTHVYHSSLGETFNFVKFECEMTGVDYNALPSADNDAEHWDNNRILEAWNNILRK